MIGEDMATPAGAPEAGGQYGESGSALWVVLEVVGALSVLGIAACAAVM